MSNCGIRKHIQRLTQYFTFPLEVHAYKRNTASYEFINNTGSPLKCIQMLRNQGKIFSRKRNLFLIGGSGIMALGTTSSACERGELCVCWCDGHTRSVQSDPLSAAQFTLRKSGGPVGRMGALEGLVFPATSESSSVKHQRLPCSLQRCPQWLHKSKSSSTPLGICNCGILGCQLPETHGHHDVQNWFCPDTLLPSNLSRFI